MTHHHTALAGALGAALLSLAACATTPDPTTQMAGANAALAQAVSAGGVEYAPAEMALARDKMVRAGQALAADRPGEALSLAQQAQADAQLAQAKAQAAKARQSVSALQDASRALRDEMARKTP